LIGLSAGMLVDQLMVMLAVMAPSRASPLPQGYAVDSRLALVGDTADVLDSGLAAGGDLNVGAGLLANAAGQLMVMLADMTPSRASSLPQG
jgi:hypothetical protein